MVSAIKFCQPIIVFFSTIILLKLVVLCVCVCAIEVTCNSFSSLHIAVACFVLFFVSSLGDFRLAGSICSSEYLIKSLWCMANICHNNFNFCFILPGADGRMMCELMNSINCYLQFIYYLANLVSLFRYTNTIFRIVKSFLDIFKDTFLKSIQRDSQFFIKYLY